LHGKTFYRGFDGLDYFERFDTFPPPFPRWVLLVPELSGLRRYFYKHARQDAEELYHETVLEVVHRFGREAFAMRMGSSRLRKGNSVAEVEASRWKIGDLFVEM
jgi:hypothetical protein